MARLHVDIETYSDVDIKTGGLYKYVQSPSFQILLVAYAVDDEPVRLIDLTTEPMPEALLLALKDNSIVKVAHNAAFDMSALRHVLDAYRIEYPSSRYICTCKAAQKTWDYLLNHKLDTVAGFLQFDFEHHNALEDALACAHILLAVEREKNAYTPDALSAALGMKIGSLAPGGYSPCSVRKNYRP